ncbi:MAG: hypothetical protein EZS28_013724, partial [Streblomastix strix]
RLKANFNYLRMLGGGLIEIKEALMQSGEWVNYRLNEAKTFRDQRIFVPGNEIECSNMLNSMAKGAKFTRMKNSTGVSITIALAKGEFDTLQEVIASAQANISSHIPLALNDAQMNEYSAQDYSNTQQTRSQQTPSTLNSSLLATIPTSLVGQLPQSLRKYIDKQKIQEQKDIQRYKFIYQSIGLTFPQKFTVLHQLKLNEFESGVKRRHNIYLILEGGNFENKVKPKDMNVQTKMIVKLGHTLSIILAIPFLTVFIVDLSMKSGIIGDISKMCENGIEPEIECDTRVGLLINNTCLKIVDTEKKAHCIAKIDKQVLLGYYKEAASGWIYLAVCVCLYLVIYLAFETLITIIGCLRNDV